jgi:hypothetical protein
LAVLKQYRTFFRHAKRIRPTDPALADEIVVQTRALYRAQANERNNATIAVCIKIGETELERLRSYVGGDAIASASASGGSGDTWLGQTDVDGSDERGRVGNQWPWNN